MKINHGVCWGLLPARGGSKSIPYKNIASFGGRPLIDYNIRAAQASQSISRLICSTDSDRIADHCRQQGVETHQRPDELAGDNTPVLDVIDHLLHDLEDDEGVAEMVALLQPTSPFLLPAHIDECVAALREHPEAGSAQTVVSCPHNHHAINQRVINGTGEVDFRYPDERRLAFNKQSKPSHYLFGNLVVFRSEALLEQRAVFATPSRAVTIDWPYDLDADGLQEFRMGELMMQGGLVDLPHMA